jgi:hypothetical protein
MHQIMTGDKPEKIMKKISFCIIILILTTCLRRDRKVDIESILLGSWTIEYLDFRKVQDIKPILVNLINFKKNSELVFPGAQKIIWSVEENPKNNYLLVLDAIEPEYNNTYRISFEKDLKNKLLKLHLDSDSINMVCAKFMFNFDMNEYRIDKVLELMIKK